MTGTGFGSGRDASGLVGPLRLQRQIDATDRQIDRLVYQLYGLTEEEVGIVEGATA